MVRKQIRLPDILQETLSLVAEKIGKNENQIIQEALEHFLESFEEKKKLEALLGAAGIWKHRKDIPDLRKLRKEWNSRTSRKKT